MGISRRRQLVLNHRQRRISSGPVAIALAPCDLRTVAQLPSPQITMGPAAPPLSPATAGVWWRFAGPAAALALACVVGAVVWRPQRTIPKCSFTFATTCGLVSLSAVSMSTVHSDNALNRLRRSFNSSFASPGPNIRRASGSPS